MRIWFRLILIGLLAMRATTAAAQISVLQADQTAPATEQKKLDKPHHPACLVEEQESLHNSPHMRWPLLLAELPSGRQSISPAWQNVWLKLPNCTNTPLQAYYRALLYPAHFFR